MGDKMQVFIAMCIYMASVVAIGLYYAKEPMRAVIIILLVEGLWDLGLPL